MVETKIIGNSEFNPQEFEAAKQLKAVFDRDIPASINGKILIKVGMICYGQDVKDIDLVVFGQFEKGFKRSIKCGAREKLDDEKVKYHDQAFRNVYINSFCIVIEVKGHTPSGIRFVGEKLDVKYNGKLYSSASEQNEKQKYSLLNFLRYESINLKPRVANLIWLSNCPSEVIPTGFVNNVLPSSFSFDYFLTKLFNQDNPSLFKGNSYYTSVFEKNFDAEDTLKKAFDFFEKSVIPTIGNITREKLEKITKQSILQDQKYVESIGKKLVLLRGRAGTGKTMKLLKLAHDLCFEKNQRCLILTFNLALVSDIRRLIALAGISDDIDKRSIGITNIHKFMVDIINHFGLNWPAGSKQPFEELYNTAINELLEMLDQDILSEEEIIQMLKRDQDILCWDKILIDEGQDWPDAEKRILFKLFKPQNFIIADGVDQMIRSNKRADWTRGVEYHTPIPYGKISFRQKTNICNYLGHLANKINLTWDVQPKQELIGGNINIFTTEYTPKEHSKFLAACLADGNQPYEVLFLVPPQFDKKDSFEEHNFKFWDGTDKNNRRLYPTDPLEHRLLFYESCRGLEGWLVVCYWFDVFLENLYNRYDIDHPNSGQLEIGLETLSEQKENYVKKWLMIPLTRAIDTLVVTLKNPQSKYSKMIIEAAEKFDFISIK